MDDWAAKKLSDVAEKIAMGPFGSNIKVATFKSTGIPIISGQHLHETRMRDFEFNFITEEHAETLKNSNVYRGDVIFTHAGNIGQVSFIPGNSAYTRYVISQRQFYLRPNMEELDGEYITYYFKSPLGQHQLLANANQTGVPSLAQPATYLKNLEVLLPPIKEQKAIASVLSSLDDKIDLLHRQNKTLEAMAETLFRQWFVEEAQEDWEEGRVENLLVLQRGFDLPSHNRIDGPYPILAASGYSGGHAEYKVKGPGVTTGRSGLLGKVFFVIDDFWPLNTSLYVKEFRRANPLFAYFFLKTLDLETYNAGSAVPTLNRNHVHEQSALLPPADLITRFEQTAFPFFQKIRQNESQVHRLESLRDALLPKLMSGEVRVAQA
jgi:type I restriction enzyme S subunit